MTKNAIRAHHGLHRIGGRIKADSANEKSSMTNESREERQQQSDLERGIEDTDNGLMFLGETLP
jgi:hypothetical protein